MTSNQSAESNAEQPADGTVALPAKVPPTRRRWLWRGGLGLVAIVLLLAGYLAGHNGKSALQQNLAEARSQRNAAQAKLTDTGLTTSISLSGVYVVGQDIKSGSWHTNGDGGGGLMSNECYFATLNSSDTSDIADNNNFDGSETVNVSGAYAFEINGPCTWYHVG